MDGDHASGFEPMAQDRRGEHLDPRIAKIGGAVFARHNLLKRPALADAECLHGKGKRNRSGRVSSFGREDRHG
jgi:hypothetical protein